MAASYLRIGLGPIAGLPGVADRLDIRLTRELPTFEAYRQHIGGWELFKASRFAKPTSNVARIGVQTMAKPYDVVGIMRSGKRYQAFIANRSKGHTGLYSVGDKLDDLTLAEVKPGRVMVGFGGETVNLVR